MNQPVTRRCKDCPQTIIQYTSTQNRCTRCLYARQKSKSVANPRKSKPIRQKGKRTLEYERWRDTVAKPYLDKTYGRVCSSCAGSRCGNNQLDVDHIQNRGSHPELRMELSNVRYLGRFPCHYEKTAGILEETSV